VAADWRQVLRYYSRSIFSQLSVDMGIDLGTANTLVYVVGQGIVLNEPSVVAIDRDSNRVLAVGEEAKRMIGRTPGNVVAIRPLRDGVIADFDITQAMLSYFISKVQTRRFLSYPRVLIGIPSGVTEVERRAVKEAAYQAGARDAGVIEEPMAAAIGAGLPVEDATGNMIVDIGGGTTEVAVISLGGIVYHQSLRVGGDEMDEAVQAYVRREANLLIGERTAEDIKLAVGSAYPLSEPLEMEVKGRDIVRGLPRSVILSADHVREAIQEPLRSILDTVHTGLEHTPPELAADIMRHGIVLAGGGAYLRGMDALINIETGIPCLVASDALSCVVLGTGRCLEDGGRVLRQTMER
jgi:rod shape-determining protein MreB